MKYDPNDDRFLFNPSFKYTYQILNDAEDGCLAVAVFTDYINYKEVKNLCVSAPSEGGVFSAEQIVRLRGKFYFIYAFLDKKADAKQFFAQELDDNFLFVGAARKIFLMKDFKYFPKSVVVTSPNEKMLMLVRGSTSTKIINPPDAFEKIDVAVLDDNFSLVWQQHFEFAEGGVRQITDAGVDDAGNFYALINTPRSSFKLESPAMLRYSVSTKGVKYEKLGDSSNENFGAKLLIGSNSATVVGLTSKGDDVSFFVYEGNAEAFKLKNTHRLNSRKDLDKRSSVANLIKTTSGDIVFTIERFSQVTFQNGKSQHNAGPSIVISWRDGVKWEQTIYKELHGYLYGQVRPIALEYGGNILVFHNDVPDNASLPPSVADVKNYTGRFTTIVMYSFDKNGNATKKPIASPSENPKRVALIAPAYVVDPSKVFLLTEVDFDHRPSLITID